MVDPGLYIIADSSYAIRQTVGNFWMFCTFNYVILRDLIVKQLPDCT